MRKKNAAAIWLIVCLVMAFVPFIAFSFQAENAEPFDMEEIDQTYFCNIETQFHNAEIPSEFISIALQNKLSEDKNISLSSDGYQDWLTNSMLNQNIPEVLEVVPFDGSIIFLSLITNIDNNLALPMNDEYQGVNYMRSFYSIDNETIKNQISLKEVSLFSTGIG